MTDKDIKHLEFLKEKSIQSFLLSIEVFNKPTVDYRLEGCVFFLCNAWELMLKAKLLQDGISIYYPDSSRTLSLTDCANKIMTNRNDPVRVNLSVITALRNTATHDIIPEFEIVYLPFLTYCVKAYADKLYEYLGINISDYVKSNFLSLFSNNRTTNGEEILSKYGENLKAAFDSKVNSIRDVFAANPDIAIAYDVNVNMVRVNNASKADFTFYASKNPKDQNVKYMDRYLDPNETHALTYFNVVNAVDKEIKRGGIPFTPIRDPQPTKKNPDPKIFTGACFDTLNAVYKFKDNTDFCRMIIDGNRKVYKYSPQLITKIITLIMDDPEIVVKNRETKN